MYAQVVLWSVLGGSRNGPQRFGRGRFLRVAHVERNYDLDQLGKAAETQEKFGGPGTIQRIEIPAEVA